MESYTFGSWNNIIIINNVTNIHKDSRVFLSRQKNCTLLYRFVMYTITGNLRSKVPIGNNGNKK